MVLNRLVLTESLRYALLVGLVVFFVLVTGQAFKLRTVLVQMSGIWDWLGVLALGCVVLAEGIIPVIALFVSGIVVGRMRTDGSLIGLYSAGISPLTLLVPISCSGLVLGSICLFSSQVAGPQALETLRAEIYARVALDSDSNLNRQVFPGLGTLHRTTAPDESFEYWGILGEKSAPRALLRAKEVQGGLNDEGIPFVILQDAAIWSDKSIVVVERALIHLDPKPLNKLMAMTGPPNSLASESLILTDVHHAFTWHKRWVFPACTVLLALLGALLGGSLGPNLGLLAGAGLIAALHGLLRGGELAARAGEISPFTGAWIAPSALLFLVLGLVALIERGHTRHLATSV